MSIDDSTYKALADKAFEESWKLINIRDGWKSARTATLACDNVDKIEWRPSPRKRWWRSRLNDSSPAMTSGRVFRVTTTMPGTVEKVSALIRDVSGHGSWNRTLQGARVVKQLDQSLLVSYQITTSNGGLIFPRDFVLATKFGKVDGCFVAGTTSVVFPMLPEEEDLVRGWCFPGCMVVRPIPGQPDSSTFQWLLEVDYGGWVPSYLVNLFLPFAQVLMVDSLKKALEVIEKNEAEKQKEEAKVKDTN